MLYSSNCVINGFTSWFGARIASVVNVFLNASLSKTVMPRFWGGVKLIVLSDNRQRRSLNLVFLPAQLLWLEVKVYCGWFDDDLCIPSEKKSMSELDFTRKDDRVVSFKCKRVYWNSDFASPATHSWIKWSKANFNLRCCIAILSDPLTLYSFAYTKSLPSYHCRWLYAQLYIEDYSMQFLLLVSSKKPQ